MPKSVDYKRKEKVKKKSASDMLSQQHTLTRPPALPDPREVDTKLMRQTYRFSDWNRNSGAGSSAVNLERPDMILRTRTVWDKWNVRNWQNTGPKRAKVKLSQDRTFLMGYEAWAGITIPTREGTAYTGRAKFRGNRSRIVRTRGRAQDSQRWILTRDS